MVQPAEKGFSGCKRENEKLYRGEKAKCVVFWAWTSLISKDRFVRRLRSNLPEWLKQQTKSHLVPNNKLSLIKAFTAVLRILKAQQSLTTRDALRSKWPNMPLQNLKLKWRWCSNNTKLIQVVSMLERAYLQSFLCKSIKNIQIPFPFPAWRL